MGTPKRRKGRTWFLFVALHDWVHEELETAIWSPLLVLRKFLIHLTLEILFMDGEEFYFFFSPLNYEYKKKKKSVKRVSVDFNL